MTNYTINHPVGSFTGTITVRGFTMAFVSGVYTGPIEPAVAAELAKIGYTATPQSAADTTVASLVGLNITAGTAAPTTGTWARGDIRFNSAPSAAGTPGWVCVAAGTPGTWKAMGNVAA
jgi:hypothetical protein